MWQEYIVYNIFMQFNLQNCYRRRLRGMWLKFFSALLLYQILLFATRQKERRRRAKTNGIGFLSKGKLNETLTYFDEWILECLQVNCRWKKNRTKMKTKWLIEMRNLALFARTPINHAICAIHFQYDRSIDNLSILYLNYLCLYFLNFGCR